MRILTVSAIKTITIFIVVIRIVVSTVTIAKTVIRAISEPDKTSQGDSR